MDASITIFVGLFALIVYLFANADNEYIFLRDRPQPWEPKRKSINYYAWRGPMFVEDFQDFEGENNPKQEIVPTCGSCTIPKYNHNGANACEETACHRWARDQCRIRTQTAEDGWRHEYWNSTYRMRPPTKNDPGNFAQVTNNNLDAPNNLVSAQMRSWMGDWFDPRDKVSPWCYANNLKDCRREEA